MSDNLETKLPPQAHASASVAVWDKNRWKQLANGPADQQVLPRGVKGQKYMSQINWEGVDEVAAVRHRGAVLPWKSPDWTPQQKADLLRKAGGSMHGRAYFGIRPGMDTASKRARNDQEQAAGIMPVSMFNPSTAKGDRLELRNGVLAWVNPAGVLMVTPDLFADLVHAIASSTAIIALGNEIGHGTYWPGDYASAVRYFAAVAKRLRALGRKDIAAPCRNYSDLAGAQADWATLIAVDTGRQFNWANRHWYTDGSKGNLDTARDVFTYDRKACDDSGRKLLVDEFGCLASAVNVPAFDALCKVVLPLADVSCVWLLAPSAGQTAVHLVNADGTDSPFAAAWRAA